MPRALFAGVGVGGSTSREESPAASSFIAFAADVLLLSSLSMSSRVRALELLQLLLVQDSNLDSRDEEGTAGSSANGETDAVSQALLQSAQTVGRSSKEKGETREER